MPDCKRSGARWTAASHSPKKSAFRPAKVHQVTRPRLWSISETVASGGVAVPLFRADTIHVTDFCDGFGAEPTREIAVEREKGKLCDAGHFSRHQRLPV